MAAGAVRCRYGACETSLTLLALLSVIVAVLSGLALRGTASAIPIPNLTGQTTRFVTLPTGGKTVHADIVFTVVAVRTGQQTAVVQRQIVVLCGVDCLAAETHSAVGTTCATRWALHT